METLSFKWSPGIWGLAAWLILVCCSPLWALPVPALRARVNDHGDMLAGRTEQQLEAMLAHLETTDSTQIVVLTIPSLAGEDLEGFSIRVAEAWGIGHQDKDNGAILLIAKAERAIRIEVGYGLEGRLTDLVAGRIIRDIMIPRFRAGDIDQGVLDGVSAMISTVRGEFVAEPGGGGKSDPASSGMGMLVFILMAINILGRLHRWVGAVAGGLLFPMAGSLFFGLGGFWLLALIPIGALAGLAISFFGGPLVFGHGGGGSSGGFRSGGFGGGSGGFGGFGGGFGGGGASGRW
jgi:uncharacterized protein